MSSGTQHHTRHVTLIEIRDTLKELQSEQLDWFNDPLADHLVVAVVGIEHAIMKLCPHDPDRYIHHLAPHVKGARDLQLVTCPACRATAPAAALETGKAGARW